MNVDVLKKNSSGQYFYEFKPDRFVDVIDEIKYVSSTNLDAKITYYIGGIEYQSEEFIEFISASAPYHDFIMRLTFMNKPDSNDEFKINSRHLLLDHEPRKLLLQNNVRTTFNRYSDGMCSKN